ncbi:hypothetical protein [Gilliamella sp. Fer4-1]|uniref:hypothetical protein n=1 Tax=Gilliamella sp. Fer4-1 TaxID=3120242 RepID=UPI00080DCD6C|nr:hypothetical protein [Gilliamella apicola]OCG55721.1 hypothetical protein A9G30_03150 [Gilliamella apicola]
MGFWGFHLFSRDMLFLNKYQVNNDYVNWLNFVKENVFKAGVAELLNLVYDSNEELGCKAEKESLGYNSSRLHPDI